MAKSKLFRKDHLIDSHDDGIKLHLREKKTARHEEIRCGGYAPHGARAKHARPRRLRPPPARLLVDGLRRRARLSRLRAVHPGLRPLHAAAGDTPKPGRPAPRRAGNHRGARHRRRRAVHLRAKRHRQAEPPRLVVGQRPPRPPSPAGKQARVRRLALYAPFYAYDKPQAAALWEDPARPGTLGPPQGRMALGDGKLPARTLGREHPQGATREVADGDGHQALLERTAEIRPRGRQAKSPRRPRAPNGAMADSYDQLSKQAALRCRQNHLSGPHHPGRSRQKLDRPRLRRRLPRRS